MGILDIGLFILFCYVAVLTLMSPFAIFGNIAFNVYTRLFNPSSGKDDN